MKMLRNPLYKKCALWATTVTQLFSHPIFNTCKAGTSKPNSTKSKKKAKKKKKNPGNCNNDKVFLCWAPMKAYYLLLLETDIYIPKLKNT